MEENNIERDIHLLESYSGMTHKMNDNQGRPKLDQAIEHILSDYKRVLKENEKLKNEKQKYKEFFNSMFLKCEDKATDKLVDEILKLERNE